MKIQFDRREGITAGELAQMCRGSLQTDLLSNTPIYGLCTDSREAHEGIAFVAICGERVDGHDFASSAVDSGCSCIICERTDFCKEETQNVAVVLVQDSEMALSYLAAALREEANYQTVAVTGSVGKTTTKDMIAAVLQTQKRVYRSSGNHNSVIGMPLSVMEIPQDCECAVLEMGMSAFGEIERMSLTAEPDIAVITNIGTSHMEMLGSRKNICRAKLEILCGLKTGGYLILNGDEPLLQHIGGRSYHTVYVSLACEKADFFAQNIRIETNCTTFDVKWKGGICCNVCMPICGKHNVYAALYAFAVGTLQGIAPEQIKQGLMHFTADEMRQNLYRHKDVGILKDCYNASPESMCAAIDVLRVQSTLGGGRSIAVLGDMLELGVESDALHQKTGAYLAKSKIDRLVAVGKGGVEIARGAAEAGMNPDSILIYSDAQNNEQIAAELADIVQGGDTVLFKASRGMRMELLIKAFTEAYR